jgi:glycosyltransferase involved in cell wall biosynthesis
MISATKISIITVTYNDPSGLSRTLSSLAKANARTWLGELIVVDASPELSAPILEEYKDVLPILHQREPKNGIYAAMNAGLAKSRHEFLWFLNGGDEFDSKCDLPAILEEFVRSGRDALCFSANLFENGLFKYRALPPRSFFWGVVSGNGICHQAMIYRKNRFEGLFPFDLRFRLAADYELHLRAWLEGRSLMPVQVPLVNYDTSGVSANFKAVLSEYGLVLKMNSSRISFFYSLVLGLGFRWECFRILFVKLLRSLPGIELVRSVWFRWKNRKSLCGH